MYPHNRLVTAQFLGFRTQTEREREKKKPHTEVSSAKKKKKKAEIPLSFLLRKQFSPTTGLPGCSLRVHVAGLSPPFFIESITLSSLTVT